MEIQIWKFKGITESCTRLCNSWSCQEAVEFAKLISHPGIDVYVFEGDSHKPIWTNKETDNGK